LIDHLADLIKIYSRLDDKNASKYPIGLLLDIPRWQKRNGWQIYPQNVISVGYGKLIIIILVKTLAI
jgi:hypothetical protein